jgi:GrpB-like predicted nucleotidyltransferase (UPF0157 family)
LPAKPVIDSDIVVTPDALPSAHAALVKAGYFDCDEMNVPESFDFRQPDFGQRDAAWGTSHKVGEQEKMRRNTNVMAEGSVALKNHLDVKRMLMSDEVLRREYRRVKMLLSEREFANIGEYAFSRNEILLKILETAGWSGEDLEEVRKANRPTI